VVIVYSFNAARLGAGWSGFTFDGTLLWRNEAAPSAAWNALRLAGLSTVVATVLGTLLGHELGRFPFRGREAVGRWSACRWSTGRRAGGFPAPSFWRSPPRDGFLRAGPGHDGSRAHHLPGAFRGPGRAPGPQDPALEAAADLGATSRQAFWHVTLPLLRPAVVAGALLAFTLSLDDFAVSFFWQFGSTTLPILIYASARRGSPRHPCAVGPVAPRSCRC
jgi:spermidine/putrescine transport system permease protein